MMGDLKNYQENYWPDSAVDQRFNDSTSATERIQISTDDIENKEMENILTMDLEQKDHRPSKQKRRRKVENTSKDKNKIEICKCKEK